MRVHARGMHRVREEIPFDVHQSAEHVLACQQRVIAATRVFDGAVKHVLSGFRNLDQRDVQIVDVHGSHLLVAVTTKVLPTAEGPRELRGTPPGHRLGDELSALGRQPFTD